MSMTVARASLALAALLVLLLPDSTGVLVAQSPGQPIPPRIPFDVIAHARAHGGVRVLVELDVPVAPEAIISSARVAAQRGMIARTQMSVLQRLSRVGAVSRAFRYIPYLAMEADELDLQALAAMRQVRRVQVDRVHRPTLAESTALVGAPTAWTAGYTGAGWAVAVLDTGVDKTHPFLAGKVISEACYSTTRSSSPQPSMSLCPGGVSSSAAADSAVPCAFAGCEHGTHVAGIAAGKGSTFSGVARDASLIAVQVFSSFPNGCDPADPSPSICSYDSDEIAGVERIYTLKDTYNIAAVNMSLGGDSFTDQSSCDADNQAIKQSIDHLRAAGIAAIVASGNDGFTNAISAPACISSAISVGSTTDGSSGASPADAISSFTNRAAFLNLLAPGQWITSSVPGGTFRTFAGTSMATPHVAGAWAVMKSRNPGATVTQILDALVSTGLGVFDPANGFTRPRIQLDDAVQALMPPCTYLVTPTRAVVGRQGGLTSFSVSTRADCAWSANRTMSDASFVSATSGIGSGTVVVSVTSNASVTGREIVVIIAGATVTIAQPGLALADMSGDRKADIVWQNLATGALATWYLSGKDVTATLSLSIPSVSDLSWRVVGSGDLNGDGFADLVWQRVFDGSLAVWFMNGAQVVSTQFLSIARVADTAWKIRAVGDTNGDGLADLIWQHESDGWLAVWYMNGPQVNATQFLSISRTADIDWEIAAAGDTNGDGKADIIWQHRTQGWLAVWYLDGVQVIGTQYLSVDRMPDTNWHIRGVGDVTADGKTDLVWQNAVTGDLGVWYLDGNTVIGQWTLSIPRVADTNWRIVGPG
jgi:subtilisin family serine protease